MTIEIPDIDYNVICAKIERILTGIANDNSDFICSRCLQTRDHLIDLAEYILGDKAKSVGYDISAELHRIYTEAANDDYADDINEYGFDEEDFGEIEFP